MTAEIPHVSDINRICFAAKDVCWCWSQQSQGSYMTLRLKIDSYCIVSISIPIVVTVKTLILLIQVDQTYQCWYKRHSSPPYRPDLATSYISPKIKVNTNHNGQCSKNGHFTASSRQLRQIDPLIHMTMPSNGWTQQRLGSWTSPSPRCIA